MPGIKLPSVYKLIEIESCGSTNDEARKLAILGEENYPDGTLVWAKKQTAGRGRRGRVWDSPPGNLYLSLILRPAVPLQKASQLSFVAALALFDALGNISEPGHQIKLKWPNDVLLQDKKVAGILLESQANSREAPAWVILGIGVNVNHFPKNTVFPSTSLSAENWSVNVEATLQAFARSFQRWANSWAEDGFEKIRLNWLQRALGLGQKIEVNLETVTLEGVFKDIDKHGALVLDRHGTEQRITAGEVYFPNN